MTRLEAFRSRTRKPGEASLFWVEARTRRAVVKVMPGEYFVGDDDVLVMTTLGSCIATCLWDPRARVGGMNHFMLPEAAGAAEHDQAGRYGSFAMELLINEILDRGAARSGLEAKVFGGGRIVAGMHGLDVGERNTRFVLDYLQTERIPVVSSDVRGNRPRKVCFLPASGQAMVKRLAPAHAATLAAGESLAAQRPMPAGAGSIDLFV